MKLKYGTKVLVKVSTKFQFEGVVVGIGNKSLQNHIVKCTDNTIPNDMYPYDTAVMPIDQIEEI